MTIDERRETTDAIRAEARRLGFDAVSFGPLGPPASAHRLGEWLEAGHHGEMAYLARNPEGRADAAREHPWGHTMVCLARTYFQAVPERPAGRVSMYALGGDYHDTLGESLKRLAGYMSREFGARTRLAVDSSPVLERPYAEQAGLGWVGKNTLLLRPDLGSYFFLAEIVTDLELVHDPPAAEEHCGTCTRCLDVCPTRAFVEPWVLDARRCISYLTIEHRGVIERELRPLMGDWIFGCDLCQEVCPWNQYARVTDEPDFTPRHDLATEDLSGFLELTEAQFRARFRRSPVYRAHRDGFLRNVAVALGNGGDPSAVPALVRALADEAWLVRLHVAWALGRFRADHPAAREALAARRAVETDPRVLSEIAGALCYDDSAPDGT